MSGTPRSKYVHAGAEQGMQKRGLLLPLWPPTECRAVTVTGSDGARGRATMGRTTVPLCQAPLGCLAMAPVSGVTPLWSGAEAGRGTGQSALQRFFPLFCQSAHPSDGAHGQGNSKLRGCCISLPGLRPLVSGLSPYAGRNVGFP